MEKAQRWPIFLEKKIPDVIENCGSRDSFPLSSLLKVMIHIKILCHAQGCHTSESKSIHCFSAFHCSLIVVLQFTKKESESFSQSSFSPWETVSNHIVSCNHFLKIGKLWRSMSGKFRDVLVVKKCFWIQI